MCDLNQFKITLPALVEGHHELELRADESLFADRGNVDVTGADITVYVDIDERHESYKIGITCQGWLEIPCDRCLDPMRLDVDEDYDVRIRYGEAYDETDDTITLPETETELDLAPMVADTVLLGIPLRHVHPEGECNPRMEEIMREHSSEDPDSDEEEL